MYASCSITGAVHGTGRHHADLEKDQIETAMEVSNAPRKHFYPPLHSATMLTWRYLVLVLLLPDLRHVHDGIQNLHLHLPPPNYC